VIAIDTNLLVYAHRTDSEFHAESKALVESLSAGSEAWAVPWPCVHEFLAIVTNPRIFKAPTPLATALAAIRNVHENSGAEFLAEGEGYLDRLESLATAGRVQSGAIHDARVAAICVFHGIRELWSSDRDFSRFSTLRVRNPLVDH
jgi:toxin-antitoxin system PIN domain toxin